MRSRILNELKQTCKIITVTDTIEDEYGNVFDGETIEKSFEASIYDANGKIQAELYGERLQYINNMIIDGDFKLIVNNNKRIYTNGDLSFSEGDELCIYGDKPDYKIISIKKPIKLQHLLCEIELIRK